MQLDLCRGATTLALPLEGGGLGGGEILVPSTKLTQANQH
jgi:hypothetical protein